MSVKDKAIFDQIPEWLQDSIYEQFLYQEFMKTFKKYFLFQKKYTNVKYNFYSWKDPVFRDFMTTILTHLEPRYEEEDQVLLYELDDVSEILFFTKGAVDIGFEINGKKYYVLRQKKSIILVKI